MARADQIRDVLANTPAITSVLTGGIYTIQLTSFTGVSRSTTPSAFDSTTGALKPCAFVGEGDLTADGAVVEMGSDSGSIVASAYRPVVIYIYTDGDYTTLDNACDLILRKLLGFKLDDTYPLEWVRINMRELEAILGIAHKSRATLVFHVREAIMRQKL